MTVLRIRPTKAGEFFPEVVARLKDLQPAQNRVFESMRRGRGGISQQFEAQSEFTPNGRTPWRQSIRALVHPKLGGTPLTLVDQGDYRRAWLGGPGGVARFKPTSEGASFRVDVEGGRTLEGKRDTFQAFRPVRFSRGGSEWVVHPRRLGVGRGMLRGVRDVIMDWAFRGQR